MKIHEYQAREIMSKFGIPTNHGELARTPEEVKAKVREYIDNGATCPILYPLGDAKLMIDIFADGYS